MNKLINDSNKTWLIDVDNTLYDPSSRLFDYLFIRYVYFISYKCRCSIQEAKKINNYLISKYNHTLVGALKEKMITKSEIEEFSTFVHSFEFGEDIRPNNKLLRLLSLIKGKKVIFSNAPEPYIKKIIKQLDIQKYIDDIYDIKKLNYRCKPNKEAFLLIRKNLKVDFRNMILIDDSYPNLEVGKGLGIKVIDPLEL